MDDILRAQVSWNQVGSGIVVNDRRILERILALPYVSPLLEHLQIVGQGDILALFIQHNLGSEFGDYSEGTFYPHLTHSIIIWYRVVWTRSFYF